MLHSAINLATNNKWIALLPFQAIDPSYNTKNVAFNLTTFDLPTMSMATEQMSYHGSKIETPSLVRAQDKNIVFSYLLSSDWHQWKVLYKWFSKFAKEEGSGSQESPAGATWFVPIRVMLLSEFKRPVFEILYHQCWIKSFGPVTCDYQDANASIIKHNFTISYSYFEFIENPQ